MSSVATPSTSRTREQAVFSDPAQPRHSRAGGNPESPAQPRNTAPQSAAGSDGVAAQAATPRLPLPGGDHSSPSVPSCLSASVPSSSPPSGAPIKDDRSKADGPAAPLIHYSCACNRVRRFAASADTCTDCHKPLSIRYDNNRPVDPNIQVKWIAMLVADTLTRLRGIIDDHRPHLSLADVSIALRTIDEARAMIRLHDLGETPLIMPRDYGERPVFNPFADPVNARQQAGSLPEGT